jgi:hypothetical protein
VPLKLLKCPAVPEKQLVPRVYIVPICEDSFKAWDEKGEYTKDYCPISSECRSYPELEGQADLLIEKLKKIKEEAKRFFKEK